MKLQQFGKQAREQKDYDIDYLPFLEPVGDTIDEINVTVECLDDPDDTSLECFSVQYTETYAKFWMRGGTPDRQYKLTALLSTVGNRIDESEIIFTIKES